jgi:hypothetical protein
MGIDGAVAWWAGLIAKYPLRANVSPALVARICIDTLARGFRTRTINQVHVERAGHSSPEKWSPTHELVPSIS